MFEYSDLGLGRFGTEYEYAFTFQPQLTKIRVPDSATSSITFRETALEYDEMVRVTKLDLPAGGTDSTFVYDTYGQLTKQTVDPSGLNIATEIYRNVWQDVAQTSVCAWAG